MNTMTQQEKSEEYLKLNPQASVYLEMNENYRWTYRGWANNEFHKNEYHKNVCVFEYLFYNRSFKRNMFMNIIVK